MVIVQQNIVAVRQRPTNTRSELCGGAGGRGEACRSAALCSASAGRLKLSGKNPSRVRVFTLAWPFNCAAGPPPTAPKRHPKPHQKKVTKMCAKVTPTGLPKGPQNHKNRTRRRSNSARKGRPKSDAQQVTQSVQTSSKNELKIEPESDKKRTWMESARPRFLLLFTALGGHRPFREERKSAPKTTEKSIPALTLQKAPKRHQKCSQWGLFGGRLGTKIGKRTLQESIQKTFKIGLGNAPKMSPK